MGAERTDDGWRRVKGSGVVVGDVDVQVCPDVETLCARLAAEIVDQVMQASGSVSLALTGGATSTRLYERLGTAHAAVAWSGVHFYWSDERLVPFDDQASNFRGAYEAWLRTARIPMTNLHRPNVSAENPVEIATAYEEEIRQCLGPALALDCVLLSLEKDGHVGSVFPGRPAARETERLVLPEIESPKKPPRRVTMTLPLINRARRVHLLAVGRAKATALRTTLVGDVDPEHWPARGVRPGTGRLRVWADSEAAGQAGVSDSQGFRS